MSKRHFLVRRKADANQKAICKALEAVGARIYDLSACGAGIPDLAVLKPNKRDVLFMEIKTAKSALRESQVEAHEGWPVVVVRTVEEALSAVGTTRSKKTPVFASQNKRQEIRDE